MTDNWFASVGTIFFDNLPNLLQKRDHVHVNVFPHRIPAEAGLNLNKSAPFCRWNLKQPLRFASRDEALAQVASFQEKQISGALLHFLEPGRPDLSRCTIRKLYQAAGQTDCDGVPFTQVALVNVLSDHS